MILLIETKQGSYSYFEISIKLCSVQFQLTYLGKYIKTDRIRRVGVRIKLENTVGRGGTADSRDQEVISKLPP